MRVQAHTVHWSGVFRGTDNDPREIGWCVTCEREVYDGEGSHRAGMSAEEWQRTSESWRAAHSAWQDWATALLRELGEQPKHGVWGDEPARAILERLARRGKGRG